MTTNTVPMNYVPKNGTSKTIIANYLLDHAGQWITTETFDALVESPSGGRRMRELRENGWKIDSRRSVYGAGREHRLVKAPAKTIQSKFRTYPKASTKRAATA